MLDRSLIQSPSSLTTTSLPATTTGFSCSQSRATSNSYKNNQHTKLHHKHIPHSASQQYDSLGFQQPSKQFKHQNNNSYRQINKNSFIMHQHQQRQQPTSTTPANSAPVKPELIDVKFNQLAKRVLSQLNQRPVEFFHTLDNILTEPLDQHEIELREARAAAKQAAVAAKGRSRSRKQIRVNKMSSFQQEHDNNMDQYYEKTGGNIVNVTGNTPPSVATRVINNRRSVSPNNENNNIQSQKYHPIQKTNSLSPSQNQTSYQVLDSGHNFLQNKSSIFEQADSSFEIEQLVYSDEDDFDDDDDSLEESVNYVTNNGDNVQAKAINLENVLMNNNNNNSNHNLAQTPLRSIFKKTSAIAPQLTHLNPIMRSNSLGTSNIDPLRVQKVKSPTKSNIVSPNRPLTSLQKSKTSHDNLSIKTTINNHQNNNNLQSRLSPNSKNSHNELQLQQQKIITSHQQKHHQQQAMMSKNEAEPSLNQQQKPIDQYQALNSLYKPHRNYSTSLLATQQQRRLSDDDDDDEIIIIPTKSPSLISNPSPDPDFASNSGLDNDSGAAAVAAAAAAAANERFSISRTKSFWEKLSNNKTTRAVNRRASTGKSLSTPLIISNNNNSITSNLNSSLALNGRTGSGLSTSENMNNNSFDYKQSLTNHTDHLNSTANQENLATTADNSYNDRYHYNNNNNNSQYSN